MVLVTVSGNIPLASRVSAESNGGKSRINDLTRGVSELIQVSFNSEDGLGALQARLLKNEITSVFVLFAKVSFSEQCVIFRLLIETTTSFSINYYLLLSLL